MTLALGASGLTKRYGQLTAVDRLDLAVEAGTLYGFLGPNGAGKSTTMRMLLGLVRPSAGSVRILGGPVSAERLRRVGALIEEPAFWGYLSGRRNLEYFAHAAGPPDDRRARLARVDEVLALVGLADAAGKKVKAYSHGMRQRLGIARALLGAPELLVLDEPTNGLDPRGMRDVRQLLRRLADDGTTVVLSSHLLSEVEAVCDQVGVLAHGRLVADGPPRSLLASGDRLRVVVDEQARARATLAALDHVAVEGAADGSLRLRLGPGTSPSAVTAALVHAGVAVSAVIPENDRLEDVFLVLTGGEDAPR